MTWGTIAILILTVMSGVGAIGATRANVKRRQKLEKIVNDLAKSTAKGALWAGVDWMPNQTEWKIQGLRITSLAEFQELTGCSDEVIVVLKLKYGEIK